MIDCNAGYRGYLIAVNLESSTLSYKSIHGIHIGFM